MGRLRRFLPPQVADLIVASGAEKQLESHRREITALFCDLRGFTGFTESADAEDVMALLREYHAAIGEIIIRYNGTLERYAGDGVMVVFNDPIPVDNPAIQAVQMALEMREAIGALTERWRQLGHEIGFGIGIAHGYATLGTIGFEGRFDYAAIGTVSNVASRLCDEAKPGQVLISPRVLMAVKDTITVEPVGEFELKGIRRPIAAYNVLATRTAKCLSGASADAAPKHGSEFTTERSSDIFRGVRRNDHRKDAAQCSKLRIGSKNSACPSTPSALPRTRSMCRCFLDLTDQDLKDIGVALGHRRKILAAIAEFAAATADRAEILRA